MADSASLPRILGLSGSLRRQASSTAILRTLLEALDGEAVTETFDIASLPYYNADLDPPGPQVAALKAAIAAADGLVIVTPEYNYSIPGVLKNAIDWASRPAYQSVFRSKPVFVVTVSGGVLGGVRAQSHLKYILNGMLAKPFVWQEVVVPKAPEKIKDGRLADEAVREFMMDGVRAFLKSLEVTP